MTVADDRLALQTTLMLDLRVKHNLFMNLPSYIYQPGLGSLQSCCNHSLPVVIVAAGPSLAENIHLLQEAKRHAVIICVGTAYKRLLAAGCVPDIVTTLDYHPISARYLEGVSDYSGSILVAGAQAAYQAIDAFRGRRILVGSPYLASFLPKLDRPWLPPGATVAHLSFHLAEYMGGEPIIFVGQDLAFSHHVTHVPGSAIHRAWYTQLNRFNTFESLEWQQIAGLRGGVLRKVPAWSGEQLYTDVQMESYLHRFEEKFEQSSATVIDATEGGAKKKGAIAMSLSEAMRRHCTMDRTPGVLRFNLWKFFESTPKPSEIVHQLEEHLDDVADASFLYTEVLALLDNIEAHYADDERWEKIAEMRREIEAKATVGRQLAAMNHKSDQLHKLRTEEMAELEGTELLKARIDRDMEYLRTLVESAAILSAMLRAGIERVSGMNLDEIKEMRKEEE